VLQTVAVCCSVLQCVALEETFAMGHAYVTGVCCNVLQSVAVCCSVLQCVAVCCSVLQSVLEWKVAGPHQCPVPSYRSGHGCSVSREEIHL